MAATIPTPVLAMTPFGEPVAVTLPASHPMILPSAIQTMTPAIGNMGSSAPDHSNLDAKPRAGAGRARLGRISNLAKLPLIDEKRLTSQGEPSFRCVVEAPRGASVKFKYDPELKAFVMGKALIKGLTYPFDWGFLPSTRGADGDPLDVMIFHDDVSSTGLVVPAQLIGVLELSQRDKGAKKSVRNDRLFAVPVQSHREDELNHVDQLSKRLREELERFFLATAELEDRELELHGWRGPKTAKALVADGVRAFREATKG